MYVSLFLSFFLVLTPYSPHQDLFWWCFLVVFLVALSWALLAVGPSEIGRAFGFCCQGNAL
jgi:hypothetical protein